MAIVSTKSEPEYLERRFQSGCDDYITKPVTQRDLFEKIKKFIPVERREHPRSLLSVTVTSTGKSLSFNEFTYDVSEGGVFVKTDSPLDPGVSLELVFSLPVRTFRSRCWGRWSGLGPLRTRKAAGSRRAWAFVSGTPGRH